VNTANNTIFYKKVVRITHKYLGPAAERFVSRQVRHHLGKEPEHLEKHELAELIDWFSMAMAILSEDEQVVHSYTSDLRKLAES
jgi:hypothetical protein